MGKSFMQSSLVIATTVVLAAITPAYGQNAAAGQKLFRSQCSICHSPRPDRNIIGPTLFGVVGRHSGRIPGFHYSQANVRSGLTWDPPTLDRYLTSPQQVVPGTLMTFPGLKDARQRADVIAYLETLH
jgi:cytochrome c